MTRSATVAAFQFGVGAVVTISGVMGIFVWGLPAAMVILLLVGAFTIWKFFLRANQTIPEILTRTAFAEKKQPNWLVDRDREEFSELAKAAFLLLLFEQTESGCWSKTYLYRHKSEELPFARGALTGTPFALMAISSYANSARHRLQPTYDLLFETLAKLLTDDGNYLKRFSKVSMMGPGPEYEKPRHAAGACLCTLIYGTATPRDLTTVENMCLQISGLESYDKAMISRLLLQAAHANSFPRDIRQKARNRCKTLLEQLQASPQPHTAAHIWAQASSFLHHDSINQWGTVWWILPSILDSQISQTLRDKLADRLRQFLLAQSAGEPTGHNLLATNIDDSGQGKGKCVFGSGVALVAWTILEKYQVNDQSQAKTHIKRMVDRIIHSADDVIEGPVSENAPQVLEGYLGWGAICLAAASLGIQMSEDECCKAVSLCRELNELDKNERRNDSRTTFENLIQKKAFFKPEYVPSVSRVVKKIAEFYREVDAAKSVGSSVVASEPRLAAVNRATLERTV